MPDYDVIIIGAGPAGLSASLYLARAQLKVLILGFPHGSSLEKSHEIGNYLGFSEKIAGPQIIDRFIAHSKKYKVSMVEEEVVHALRDGETFTVKTATNKSFTSRALIIAAGMKFQKSGFANEDAYVGKGIHYCVACDGVFYKGKKVAVIGSGNYAAEEALELTAYTKEITILGLSEFSFTKELEAELKKARVTLKRISGKSFAGNARGMLDYIQLDTGEKLKFDGVFVAVGTASGMAFANKLGIDHEGVFLRTDRDGRTNVPRVYAAGGCTGGNIQVGKSVGEGCNAAISCIKDLLNKTVYTDYT
ncbi:MAG: NAD(P)/FAD-dependent oxidoreductase [Candidatus Aenigmatarchaeota archaeon]|nr:MAG: NAD(P)/FAD-dependent oxidoreductase [Candidatus Aenigmarchaeota archaeon]